jgi:UDPglucose--hexose-1-phosphate uridylyltransferase
MLNELRKDIISGQWVLFATGRAKKAVDFREGEHVVIPKDKCPFEDPEAAGNEILVTYDSKGESDWFIKCSTNKYPSVVEGEVSEIGVSGPFPVINANGHHEVVIFRDHDGGFYNFTKEEAAEVFKVYKERFISIMSEPDHSTLKYTMIFHNAGPKAGATLYHPHSQIIALPIIPPEVMRWISGSKEYYEKNGEKASNAILNWELKENKRIIFENNSFVALCPFASKTPYEIRIAPKNGSSNFEEISEDSIKDLGEIVSVVFAKLGRLLNEPDFNFYIFTAPIDNDLPKNLKDFYSWYLEIVPRVGMLGAVEISSGVFVNVVDPDEVAKSLVEVEI